MDINGLIEQYGYAALVIGSVAEGETITLLGGVAAHRGIAEILAGGRRRRVGRYDWRSAALFSGAALWPDAFATFCRASKKIRRAQRLIQRHPYLFVIGTRFMYGFRIIGPILIGASRLPPKIFLPLNILGAIARALIFTTLGYAGGEVIGPWLHNLDQHLKHWAWLITVVAVVIGVRLWLKHREKRRDEE